MQAIRDIGTPPPSPGTRSAAHISWSASPRGAIPPLLGPSSPFSMDKRPSAWAVLDPSQPLPVRCQVLLKDWNHDTTIACLLILPFEAQLAWRMQALTQAACRFQGLVPSLDGKPESVDGGCLQRPSRAMSSPELNVKLRVTEKSGRATAEPPGELDFFTLRPVRKVHPSLQI